MTNTYYNIVRVNKDKDYSFAIYVSEDANNLMRSKGNKNEKIWSRLKERLGKEDAECQWHKYAINIKSLNSFFKDLGIERSDALYLEGDRTIKI